MGFLNEFRQVALFLLAMLFVGQGSCDSSQCDDANVTNCLHDFLEPINAIIETTMTKQGPDRETMEAACREVTSLLSCTRQLTISGCSEEIKQLELNFQKRSLQVRSLICQDSGHRSLVELNRCVDGEIRQTCEEKVYPQAFEEDVGCRFIRNKMDCWLTATVGCPPSAGSGRDVLENYFLAVLDVRHCYNSGFTPASVTWFTLGVLASLIYFFRRISDCDV